MRLTILQAFSQISMKGCEARLVWEMLFLIVAYNGFSVKCFNRLALFERIKEEMILSKTIY